MKPTLPQSEAAQAKAKAQGRRHGVSASPVGYFVFHRNGKQTRHQRFDEAAFYYEHGPAVDKGVGLDRSSTKAIVNDELSPQRQARLIAVAKAEPDLEPEFLAERFGITLHNLARYVNLSGRRLTQMRRLMKEAAKKGRFDLGWNRVAAHGLRERENIG